MRFHSLRLAALVAASTIVAGVASCGQPRTQQARRPAGSVSPAVPVAGTGELGGGTLPASLPEHAGPSTVVDGAPMGYRRDLAGAKAAAVSFARLNQALVQMDEADVTTAWRAMSATAAADGLVADVAARLGALRQRWPRGTLSYRVAPLAVRASEVGPDQMRVEVWYVGIVAGRDLPTYEEWVTETYRLVWERGDWRVAAFSDTPGPRPAPGSQQPASAAEIEARLAGFEALP